MMLKDIAIQIHIWWHRNLMSYSELLKIVNELTQNNFNGILVNHYCDGNQYIGAHSDDEKELGTNGVVSISYGSERKFRIREKKTKNF